MRKKEDKEYLLKLERSKSKRNKNLASIIKMFAISEVDGCLVNVETKTIDEQPLISIIDLVDTTEVGTF